LDSYGLPVRSIRLSEKECLEKTLIFLEGLGKKTKAQPYDRQNRFLSRYGIGSMASLKKFYKFKKQQLKNLEVGYEE
jgi:hypothetical protein